MRTSPRAVRSANWKEEWEFQQQILALRAQVVTAGLQVSEDVAKRITTKFRAELKKAFRRQIERQKRESGYPSSSHGETSENALYNSLSVLLQERGDTRYISSTFGEGLPYAANLNKPEGTGTTITKTPGTRGLHVPNRRNIPRGRMVPFSFVVQKVHYPGQEVFDRPYQKTLAKLSDIVAAAVKEAEAAMRKRGVEMSAGPHTVTVKGSDHGIVTSGKYLGRRVWNVRDAKGRFTSKG